VQIIAAVVKKEKSKNIFSSFADLVSTNLNRLQKYFGCLGKAVISSAISS
jgi:hypothetical protein